MPGTVWQHREGMHEIEDKAIEWRPQDAGDDRSVEHLPRKESYRQWAEPDPEM